ncbi:MAG: CopD family protein [Alphaproteobacteria bacterium]
MATAVTLHLLAAVIWVGGMFFAVYVMRLAAAPMEPPERVALWGRGFQKFFPWVWIAVLLLPATGYYMVFTGYSGFKDLPLPYHVMHGLGWLMIALYLHLWFAPYARLKKALAENNVPEAGNNLNQIRIIVTTNLWLGLLNVALGVLGRYLG